MYMDDKNIEDIVFDVFQKSVKMTHSYSGDLFKPIQKEYICNIFKENISKEDLEKPEELLEKIKNCLIEAFTYEEDSMFSKSKPPRIICPEKNSEKFNSLLNRMMEEFDLKKN